MNIQRKQHQLLKLLYNYDQKFIASNHKINPGLSWDEISKALNVTKDELNFIAGRPVADKDIEGDTRLNPPLYYIAKPNGMAALGERKYLKESENWFDTHPKVWDLTKIFLAAILGGSVSLLVGWQIAQWKFQEQQQINNQQSISIDSLRGEIKILQEHLKN